MRDCLHGSEGNHTFGYTNSYGDEFGDDHGDSYGSGYSYTRAHRGDLRRGFAGRFHRGFDSVAGDQNGGGTINGGDAGTRNGHRDGYATGYGTGSRSDYGSDSCVEVRRELTNPYIITVPPPASEAQAREIEKDDRLWRDRCRPVVKQDRYGVNRYVYAAPGCEFGKYE